MKNDKTEVQEVEAVAVETVNDDEVLASESRLDEIITDDVSEEAGEKKEVKEENASENLFGLLSLIPITFTMTGYETAAGVWSNDVCRGVSDKAIPVLEKYTWGQRFITFLNGGGAAQELALAAVLFPVGMATYNAIQIDTKIHTEKAQKAKEEKEAENVADN